MGGALPELLCALVSEFALDGGGGGGGGDGDGSVGGGKLGDGVRVGDGGAPLGQVSLTAALSLEKTGVPFDLGAHALKLGAWSDDAEVQAEQVEAGAEAQLNATAKALFNLTGVEAVHRLLTRLAAGDAEGRSVLIVDDEVDGLPAEELSINVTEVAL
ncbi:hypothetical protein T492DRAFT_875520 [Pavlovales sp. CCMP2436]|nr:hypothetical protein T492DRAFT_875520 [Pavlovales sp. CCMP2436]